MTSMRERSGRRYDSPGVLLDQGRIAERGRHGELVAMGGLYARMQQLQSDDDSRPDRSDRQL